MVAALATLSISLTGAVYQWQVVNRAPLVWDEARRVQPGVEFVRALSTHSIQNVVDWANAQTFYPFLSSLPSGIVLWFGGGITTAAWLPPLVGFFAAGYGAAALARLLGVSRVGSVAAGALVWTTPLIAKLSGAMFTEPIGACVSLAVLVGLVQQTRRPTYPTGVLTGFIAGSATALKYDYGILLLGVVGASELLRVNTARSRRSVLQAIACVGTVISVNASFFLLNTAEKVQGAKVFIRGSTGDPNASLARTFSRIDFLAYPRQFVTSADVGLSAVVVLTIAGGLIFAVARWRSSPSLRPLLVFVALWWVMYSLGGIKYARYAAPVVPVLLVLAVVAVDAFVRRLAERPDLRWVPAATWTLIAIAVATQFPAESQKFGYLRANEPIENVVGFLRRELRPSDRPLLFVGPSNELSPELVHLTWDAATGHPTIGTQTVPEAEPDRRAEVFLSTLENSRPDQILVVTFDAGARIDTTDQKLFFASQPAYVDLVAAQELSGAFSAYATYTTDRGRLHVRLLTRRIATNT